MAKPRKTPGGGKVPSQLMHQRSEGKACPCPAQTGCESQHVGLWCYKSRALQCPLNSSSKSCISDKDLHHTVLEFLCLAVVNCAVPGTQTLKPLLTNGLVPWFHGAFRILLISVFNYCVINWSPPYLNQGEINYPESCFLFLSVVKVCCPPHLATRSCSTEIKWLLQEGFHLELFKS